MAAGQNLLLSLILRFRDEASQGLNNARTRVRDLGQEVGRLAPLDNAVKNTFANIKAYVLSAFAVSGLIQFSSRLTDTIRDIQDLGLRLSGVAKSSLDFAASQAYLNNLAGKYHKSISALTGSFSNWLALENAGVITRQQSIQLLQGFANVAAKTGASQDQMAQSSYGLAQALGTGIVAMEEFKQITDPMPGLANEIAKAFGMTVGQLRALIGTGTVASDEFGRKFVIALKAYEGAAERAGGTVSATYADIGNAYNDMARALEKPVATGLLALVDVGKSAFGWIKDNSGEIITSLEVIAVTLTGKLVGSLSAVTMGYAARYQAEVRARASAIALAEADVAAATGNAELAQSNLALIQSDLRAEAATLAVTNATIARSRAEIEALSSTVQSTTTAYLLRNATLQLAEAEAARSASLVNMAALGRQQAAVSTEITAAQTAQAESTLALEVAATRSSVVMARLAAAGKAAFAFVGGWVGVAVIALYGLYTALEKITGSEEKAAIRAKALSDALARSAAEVKKLSESEVDIDFAKTEKNIDDVQKKIEKIENFPWSEILNVGDLSAQRANLLQTLDVLKQRKDALVAQKNEQIMNFDASTLSAEQLTVALEETKAKITEISNRVEPLKQQVADGLIGSQAIEADLQSLSAYNAKLSALQAAAGAGAVSQEQLKASFKKTQEAVKELTDSFTAMYQHEVELSTQREQQKKLELEKSVTDEQERGRRVTDIVLQADKERIVLATNYAAEQTRIIESMYSKEIEKAKANGLSVAEIEKTLLNKKLEVLRTLEAATKTAIDSMIAEEQRHLQAAQAAAEQRKNVAISAEEEILAFLRESMDAWEKAYSFQNEQETQWAALRKAQAEGDFEEQQRIARRLMDLALERGRTEREIAKENDESVSSANDQAVASYKTALEAMQNGLKGLQDAEQGAADKAHAAAEEAGKSLDNVQAKIGDLQNKLAINTASTHTITDNVADVMARIKSLDGQNTTSTHTVKEVTEQARQHGGPIYRLNTGGKLPGWGGGDTVPAMLEPGEFVVRKEAVAKYGGGLFARLNAMKANAGDVIKRRFGGIIPGFATGGSVGEAPRMQFIQSLGQSSSSFNRRMIDDQMQRQQFAALAEMAKLRKAMQEKIAEIIKPFSGQKSGEQKTYQSSVREAETQNEQAVQKINQTYAADINGSSDPDKLSAAKATRESALKQQAEQHESAMAKINSEHQERRKSIDVERMARINSIYEEFKVRVAEINKANPLRRNSGGSIPGSGNTDTVPAMLTPGEWVINKTSVAHYGGAFMDAVNRGVLPKGFNTGGPVGPASGSGSMVVQFKAPDGQTAQAQFGSRADVNQFLEVIKLSGGVTA